MSTGSEVTGAVDTSLTRTNPDPGELQGRGALLLLFSAKGRELVSAGDVK